jgi:hypothetical protein
MRPVRIGLLVVSAFGVVPLEVRYLEFPALNISWETNAYGSITCLPFLVRRSDSPCLRLWGRKDGFVDNVGSRRLPAPWAMAARTCNSNCGDEQTVITGSFDAKAIVSCPPLLAIALKQSERETISSRCLHDANPICLQS